MNFATFKQIKLMSFTQPEIFFSTLDINFDEKLYLSEKKIYFKLFYPKPGNKATKVKEVN